MSDIMDYKNKIKIAYDGFASDYDASVASKMDWSATRLLSGLQIPENPTVLDIGCGTGIATFELLKRVHGKGKFYGVDLSQEMIDIAKAKAMESGQANIEFSKCDAEELDFPESTFDLIVSNQVFHWIPNKGKLLEAMLRVLKPMGKTATAFQGGSSFKELFEAYDRIRQLHPEYALIERPKNLTLEETQELFEEAGFRKCRIFAIHEVTWINPSLFWSNKDLTTSPWKIGLSSENAEKVQKEVAGELLKIKPADSLRTKVTTIFVYAQKQPNP